MAKTSKLLTIVVSDDLADWSEIAKLEEQGHTIVWLAVADLVIGPQCWLMTDRHRKYLSLAIKAARLRKYPPKKGAKSADDDD